MDTGSEMWDDYLPGDGGQDDFDSPRPVPKRSPDPKSDTTGACAIPDKEEELVLEERFV